MLVYGVLTVAAVLLALLAGRAAAFSALVVLAGWVLFNLSWTPYAPDLFLQEAGISLSFVDVWAATDMIAAAAILYLGRDQWWSISLWALLTAQVSMHCFYQFTGLEYGPYAAALDVLYIGQLTIFFMLGGGNVANLLYRYLDAWDGHSSHSRAAHKEAQK